MATEELDLEEWLRAHREAGARPGCGYKTMAEHVNPQIVSIWLNKRIEHASDPVVRDHLQRSLRWLTKALAAEKEGSSVTAKSGPLARKDHTTPK